MLPFGELQTTDDDDDRRQRPLLVCMVPYTMCRRASNVLVYYVCDSVTEEESNNVQVDDTKQPLVIKHYCTKLREKNKASILINISITYPSIKTTDGSQFQH